MKTMSKDIQTKVGEIVGRTEEAKDLQILSKMELLGFLSSAIKEANAEDEILAEANRQLLQRLQSAEDDPMSLSALVRIIELKEKNSSERKVPLLKIIEAMIKPNPNDKQKEVDNNLGSDTKEIPLTQEDYSKAKETYNKLNKLIDKIGIMEGVK
jgi:hypothetical protein